MSKRITLPTILLAIALSALLPALASAGTMTFVNMTASGYTNYVEDGLRVTTDDVFYLYTTTMAMFPRTNWQTITLTLENGGPFTLQSLDMREKGTPAVQQVIFTGNVVGGGTVATTITTDGVSGWETFAFPASFTNLESVTWTHADYTAAVYYDNIVAEAAAVSNEATSWSGIKALYAGD